MKKFKVVVKRGFSTEALDVYAARYGTSDGMMYFYDTADMPNFSNIVLAVSIVNLIVIRELK